MKWSWFAGSLIYRREVKGWCPVEFPTGEAEVRVFVGPTVSTAVLRLRRWGKAIYSEPGRTAALLSLSDQDWRNAVMGFVKRATAAAGAGDSSPFPDARFAKSWPALYGHMTETTWEDDGKPRKTSTLLLFCQDSQLKACLGERNAELSLWAAGKTLEMCLNALEGLLTSDDPPWRSKGQGGHFEPAKGRQKR